MKHFTLLLLLTVTKITLSQNYFYLEDIKLKEKSDFVINEPNAIKAIDYMLSTPVDEKNVDRKACTRFIIRYVEGTPYYTVTLGSYVTKLYKKNTDLLVMYMGLWSKSAINNKEGKPEDHEKYILTEIYKYAKAGNNIKKTEMITSLIEAGDQDKIGEWLQKAKK